MVSYTTSQPAGQGPQRIKKTDRQYIERLNYDNIQFPVTVKDYIRIEKQNEIRVNAFGHTCPCEDKQPFLIYVSKERYNNCLNLLLLSELIREHHLGKPRDDEPTSSKCVVTTNGTTITQKLTRGTTSNSKTSRNSRLNKRNMSIENTSVCTVSTSLSGRGC